MGVIEIVLIVVLLLVLVGALGPWGSEFRGPGLGIGGVLLIAIVVILLMGGT